MKTKATVYLPDRLLVFFETDKENVKSICQYGDLGIKITFNDGSTSVFYNMPFEYHEHPEEIDKSDFTY